MDNNLKEINKDFSGLESESTIFPDALKNESRGSMVRAMDTFSHISILHSSPKAISEEYSAVRYGKRYLLKCLKKDYRNDPVYNLILHKEFEIGISLDHPNIRRTIGFEEIEDLGPSIILEYVDGETLDKTLDNGRISRGNVRNVISQITEALRYLHSKQIIHGDIKPQNIMLTYSEGMVKLIDFSLADSNSYVVLKNLGGTRDYMAPELLSDNADASTKSDIYSFGKLIGVLGEKFGDKELIGISGKCVLKDPAERPASFYEINIPAQGNTDRFDSKNRIFSWESKDLSWILCIIITILTGFIFFILYLRFR